MSECVRAAKRNGSSSIICASGGNAGLAVAHAARSLSLPCHIVLPETSLAIAQERLKSLGAKVTLHGLVWNDANNFAMKLASEEGAAYVHPYDSEIAWEGHASIIDEIAMDLKGVVPSAVIASVGGGGLLGGVMKGVDRQPLYKADSRPRIIAVETHGSNCLNAAVTAGKLVTLPSLNSVAKSLGASQVASGVFDMVNKIDSSKFTSTTVSDKEAVYACRSFLNEQRMLVEPACGAALSIVYDASKLKALVPEGGDVVVIVCGGSIISLDDLNDMIKGVSS
jgi:L-serine/L-threonine ammonia-lyase